MTIEEAAKVAAIAATADRGCPSCVRDMVARLDKAFPEFVWEIHDELEYQPGYVTVKQR